MESPPNARYDVTTYPPRLKSVPLARRRVTHLAADWGHLEIAADAALVTSELVTNAVLHGCLKDRLFRLEVILTGTVLRIAVTDPKGERRPSLRAVASEDQFGRGLVIVQALAACWDVEELTVGKTVWAELDLRLEL
ncbi:ATP-binding protein [Streptomyces sp. B-S-A8]|uniref:ATP-binding protein n=1 Tax=Streptomyces solicavernae TaxID=3043614 RepID=A0ABT6RMI1_9ACTN|nr:ATP-binding protein [Streptomyces sp. B-S-A8]MDI3385638.1 ATP-binding protein [Streptomyces sp. B-S-A8]